MSAPTPQLVVRTYRAMLKSAKMFPVYSFREHALRRTREEFHKNKALKGTALISAFQRMHLIFADCR